MQVRTLLGIFYTWIVVISGTWVLATLLPTVNFDYAVVLGVFILVVMVGEWLVVSLPHGQLTSTFSVTIAAFLLFGAAEAAWVTALGTLFGQGIVNRGNPLRTTLFNTAQFAVAAFAGYQAYLLAGGLAGQPLVLANILPIAAFCVAYFLVNHLLVSLYLQPKQRHFPLIGRRSGIEWDASTYLVLVPLGVLTVLLYNAVGLLGAILVLVPALAVQFILARFVKLELNNLELTALYEVAKHLSTTLDLERLLDLILEETRRFLAYHTAIVYLWSPEREQYVPVAVSSKYAEELKDTALEKEEGIVAWAIELKEPGLVYDSRSEPLLAKAQGLPQFLRSLLVIPLVVEDQVKGIMLVGDRRPYAYNERNLHLLTIIAGQAAVAINNLGLSRRVQRLIDNDPLTGVMERSVFWDALKHEFVQAQSSGRSLSVVLLDLDRFRAVNQEYGFGSGDGILVQIAELLKSRIRDKGYLARYDGQIFALLIPDTGQVRAAEIGERLCRAVENCPFRIEGSRYRVNVGINVGVATYPVDADNVDDLLLQAEQSLREFQTVNVREMARPS
ncbi:MAG: sensor domain-containing diguanylate cyclase [Eubacteriales bacterium]|nr:sensor domain-containing diguanylate cyclase [Bacillota bacterium]MBV1728448.1 sensor domain-containing diguanylate cyclase [Desulforudis sp.]MDZ4043991.1 sensor domain-containing diguanylate cyclase [Eubacteriales bacterium]MBU4533061.1 sensor domain-containing diguanylate cyclase [Bacillota bacterium]MBU4554734.1 sensor domain-containing diguanylate cyclase [Bacillota bacterium]